MGEWSMSFRREGEQVHLNNQDGCHAVNAQPGSASGSPGRHLGVAVGGGADPFRPSVELEEAHRTRTGGTEPERARTWTRRWMVSPHAPHMGVA